ncbi:MAG: hypothetical protein L3J86_05470, partial [Thermoplasmata archaeon]|nr:hypothetical protein [Thermoplasmata archaeon]
MADEKPKAEATKEPEDSGSAKDSPSSRTPKKSDGRAKTPAPTEKAAKPAKKAAPKAPRRPTLEPELARLLS